MDKGWTVAWAALAWILLGIVIVKGCGYDTYRRVDQCQHEGMPRNQCWCLEKHGWDAEAMRACVLTGVDDGQ